MVMDEVNQMTLTFRCPRELDKILPRPIPAVHGLATAPANTKSTR
jgi:hypothetical protein